MLAKKRTGATQKRKGSSGMASLIWMFVGSILTLMIGLFLYLWNPFTTNDPALAPDERTVAPIANGSTEVQGDEYEFYDLLPQQEVSSIPDETIVEGDYAEDASLSPTERALQQALLEPDVVVRAPEEQDNTSNTSSQSTAQQSDTPVAATGDNEIVIIEEEGTYDGGTALTNNRENTATQPQASITRSNSSEQATNTPAPTTPPVTYILQINSFSSAEEADNRRAQVLMAGVDAQVVRKDSPNGQLFYQVVTPIMTNRQEIVATQQRLQNNGIDSLIIEQRR